MLIKCTASIGGNYHNSFSESITKFSRPPLHTHKPSLQDDDKLELILNCLMSAILQQTVAIGNLREKRSDMIQIPIKKCYHAVSLAIKNFVWVKLSRAIHREFNILYCLITSNV